jgi:hypothetical protein
MFLLQYNAGLGWRALVTPYQGPLPEAVELLKEHHEESPYDHIRVVRETVVAGVTQTHVFWWKDGHDAPERWV